MFPEDIRYSVATLKFELIKGYLGKYKQVKVLSLRW